MTEARDRMRIGIISGEYPPMQGGVGDFAACLAASLAGLGHDVHVITGQAPQESGDQPGVVVHRLRTSWGCGCWRKIVRLAGTLDLEVIDVQYQAAAYAMRPAINFVPHRSRRPPVAVTFHDLRVPYLFPKAGPLRWQVIRLLARRADGVIATNEEDQDRLRTEAQPRNLALIPIGSNVPVVAGSDRVAERAKWGAGPGDLLIGHFGFLNESKGVEELVEATKLLIERSLPGRLLMIGGRLGTSDPTNRRQAAKIDALVRDLGLEHHVTWTGLLPAREASAALTATDVCVLPYRDGASFRRTTLLACLAHGRAVVTTRPAVNIDELRDGQNLLLVDARQPKALANAIARVVGDPALRARLEAGAQRLRERFSWDRIGRDTAAYLGILAYGPE
jgi:glycosyltransferase involved in cell wall biosynthesis